MRQRLTVGSDEGGKQYSQHYCSLVICPNIPNSLTHELEIIYSNPTNYVQTVLGQGFLKKIKD